MESKEDKEEPPSAPIVSALCETLRSSSSSEPRAAVQGRQRQVIGAEERAVRGLGGMVERQEEGDDSGDVIDVAALFA